MSYRSLPIGNLSNTNITFGSGIQSDASFSYVTVNCDPKVVLPRTSVTDPVNPSRSNPKRYEGDLDIAGKIAVERDICNLEVANLKVTGTLIVPGDTVLSCTVIKADGAVCCPLTVENTNAQTSAQGGQVGNALCVKGSTLLQPVTDPVNDGVGATNIKALLFLDGTLPDGTTFLSGDYMRIDARPLTIGNAIEIDIAVTAGAAMTGKGIRINKGGSSMENITTGVSGAPGARLLYINALTERGANFDDGVTPNKGDAVVLGEIRGPYLTDISTVANPSLKPPGLQGTRQSALWVNCVPDAGSLRINPVGALWIDGGTTFSGQSTTDTTKNSRLSPTGQILSLPPLPPAQQPTGTPVGTYTNVATVTGGPGAGALLNIVINPVGIVESVTIANSGAGYAVGDPLIVPPNTMDPAQSGALVFEPLGFVVLGNGQGHLHSRQVDLQDNPLSPGLVGLNRTYQILGTAVGEDISLFFGQKIGGGGYNNPPARASYGTDVCGIVGFQQRGSALSKIRVIYNTPYPEGTVPVVHLTPGAALATDLFKQYTTTPAPTAGLAQFLAVDYDPATGILPNEGFTISLTTGDLSQTQEPRYIHYNVMAVIE